VHVTTQAALFAAPKLASAGRSGMNFIARTGSVWTSSGTSRPIFPECTGDDHHLSAANGRLPGSDGLAANM
jgi:hypothetical protein